MIVYLIMLMISMIGYKSISGKRTILDDRYHLPMFRYGKLYLNRIDLAIFFASLPFAVVSGLRYDVGTDYWPTYYTGFYRILNNIEFDGFEFGYFAIVKFIQIFTDNAFVLIFFLSVLFIYFTFKAIKEQSKDILLSILLLFITRYFFISMNGVRQFLAMAILLYSLKYVLSREKGKFLFWFFIAFSIHYMSIVFLPVYYLYTKRINFDKLICYIVIAAIGVLIIRGSIFKILANTRFGQADRYAYAGIKFTIFTIAMNVLICFTFYLSYKNNKEDPRYRLYLNIEFVAMLISIFIRAIPAMERVYWFYSFPIIISFPYCIKKERYAVLRWMIITFFVLYLIYDIIILRDHEVLPYQFIFGHEAKSIIWEYQMK